MAKLTITEMRALDRHLVARKLLVPDLIKARCQVLTWLEGFTRLQLDAELRRGWDHIQWQAREYAKGGMRLVAGSFRGNKAA